MQNRYRKRPGLKNMFWGAHRASYGEANISGGRISQPSRTHFVELKNLKGGEERARLEEKKKYLEEKMHAIHARIEQLAMATRKNLPLSKTKTALKAVIDLKMCFFCGICANFCPEGAIRMMEKPWIDQLLCTGCGTCVPLCPRSAISLKPMAEGQH